ncbi:GNAT family N-acetyltransferase [uncultured Kordia sp.]|uniref:GNAT family N-acetyltransferase n=1 Tax=uncultured Kordia sp. TaxID=507699 RepID=UPI0026258C2F|nr:GNAT family N-acetyltransferase [uncultured Kordia sp.]
MIDNNFPEIQTERLLLKRLGNADWEIISFLRSDKTVNEFVKRPSAETKEKALAFIEKINNGIDNQLLYYWKITEKDASEMIGSICLWNFSEDKKTAEVGYDLHPKHQGKGIMNETLKGIIEFGFQKLNLDLIEAYTHRQNESSKKLLKKNGFTLIEGKIDPDNADNSVYELKK